MQSEDQRLPPGLRVLLVEDEPLIAMDGEATLRSLGVAHVACARSLADGLRIIEEEAFDVALLDLQLDRDTSLPIAHRLRELGVPFGFLTGYVGDVIPDEFREQPMVPKPFNTSQIVGLLHALLDPPPEGPIASQT